MIRQAIRNAGEWLVKKSGQDQASAPMTSHDLAKQIERSSVSAAGMEVSPETAMRITTVNACVRILSNTIGSLPLILYRRLAAGGRERLREGRIAEVLHTRPNGLQTPMGFWQTKVVHLALRGAAYSLQGKVDGELDELLPIHPDRMQVELRGGRLVFIVYPRNGIGEPKEYGPESIFYLHGLTSDGFTPRSIIKDARDSLGLALAQERYGATAYSSGGLKRIVLKHPGVLKDDASKRIANSFQESVSGTDKFHKPAVLEEGMDLAEMSMTAEDLQYLEARRFQKADIATLFNIPLSMLNEGKDADNKNEQEAIRFVVHTIRPWLVGIEQAINLQLLKGDPDLFAEFKIDGLLRGDIEKRYKAYAIARQWGLKNVDEIRELENENPLPNGKGKIYLQPVNMIEAGTKAAQPVQPGPENDERGTDN